MDIMSQSFRVSWSSPSELNAPDINYTLQLTITGPPPVGSMNMTGITDETYLFEGLTPFTTYTVVVFAVSEKGPGPGSDPTTVMTAEDGRRVHEL